MANDYEFQTTVGDVPKEEMADYLLKYSLYPGNCTINAEGDETFLLRHPTATEEETELFHHYMGRGSVAHRSQMLRAIRDDATVVSRISVVPMETRTKLEKLAVDINLTLEAA